MIDLIGFGIVIPILPLYAKDLGASPTVIGALASSYALMQFLFAPLWGRLSDRYGRRPIILIALAGSAISSLLIGLATSLVVLFVARILNGISGASYSAAQAYVADVTTPEERAKGMGLIGAAFGLGFVLGPAIGGLCAIVDPRFPFFVAAGVAALNLVLAWRRLPEPERRPSARSSQRELLRAAFRDGRIAPMITITFLGTFAFVGMEQTFALLGQARFDFGLVETGLVFTYIGIIVAVVQGKAIGPLVVRLGERRVMLTGLVLTGVALGLLAITTHLWALFPVMALLAASGLVFPDRDVARVQGRRRRRPGRDAGPARLIERPRPCGRTIGRRGDVRSRRPAALHRRSGLFCGLPGHRAARIRAHGSGAGRSLGPLTVSRSLRNARGGVGSGCVRPGCWRPSPATRTRR